MSCSSVVYCLAAQAQLIVLWLGAAHPAYTDYKLINLSHHDATPPQVYLGWQGRGASGNACFVVKDSRAYEAAKYEHLCVANASAGWSTSQRGS